MKLHWHSSYYESLEFILSPTSGRLKSELIFLAYLAKYSQDQKVLEYKL